MLSHKSNLQVQNAMSSPVSGGQLRLKLTKDHGAQMSAGEAMTAVLQAGSRSAPCIWSPWTVHEMIDDPSDRIPWAHQANLPRYPLSPLHEF